MLFLQFEEGFVLFTNQIQLLHFYFVSLELLARGNLNILQLFTQLFNNIDRKNTLAHSWFEAFFVFLFINPASPPTISRTYYALPKQCAPLFRQSWTKQEIIIINLNRSLFLCYYFFFNYWRVIISRLNWIFLFNTWWHILERFRRLTNMMVLFCLL